jgi:hypothetical protein
MSAGRAEAVFKEKVETLISEFQRRTGADAPATYVGAAEDTVLEHTARKYFLDKFLQALGWDVASFNHDIAEEARVKDNTTVFMDYLGVHPDSRAPVLIFEAKAWEKPLVTASEGMLARPDAKARLSYVELISIALKHCKDGEDKARCPVSQEWRDWLLKLTQYVTAVRNKSGHAVKRVAVSSGQWIVVFDNPTNAFIDRGLPSTDSIFVFRIEDYVGTSDDIYQLLSKHYLLDALPPAYIRPEQIGAFLSLGVAKKLFLGVWIHQSTTGSIFDVHPQILIYPAVLVQRADEEFVTIVDPGLGHDPMPPDSSTIGSHIEGIRERSERLLGAVRAILPGLPNPSALTEFPGFIRSPARGSGAAIVFTPDDADRDFLKSYPLSSGQFILATGENSHFIVESPRIAGCRGHDWAACKAFGEHVGDQPIVARSSDPASYFISGELHHCAHRILHGRRDGQCKVRAFETFLCCQACTYQPVCWSGVSDLPCGVGGLSAAGTSTEQGQLAPAN